MVRYPPLEFCNEFLKCCLELFYFMETYLFFVYIPFMYLIGFAVKAVAKEFMLCCTILFLFECRRMNFSVYFLPHLSEKTVTMGEIQISQMDVFFSIFIFDFSYVAMCLVVHFVFSDIDQIGSLRLFVCKIMLKRLYLECMVTFYSIKVFSYFSSHSVSKNTFVVIFSTCEFTRRMNLINASVIAPRPVF